jgi:hypothetical protein
LVAEDREMDTLASGAVVMPRALVAISEDRHWLVTHEANEMPLHFAVWRRAGSHVIGWIFERYVEDTGQDAHEVLAAFLADRGGV